MMANIDDNDCSPDETTGGPKGRSADDEPVHRRGPAVEWLPSP